MMALEIHTQVKHHRLAIYHFPVKNRYLLDHLDSYEHDVLLIPLHRVLGKYKFFLHIEV